MKKRYQGRCSPLMLADYGWTRTRDQPDLSYQQESLKNVIVNVHISVVHQH